MDALNEALMMELAGPRQGPLASLYLPFSGTGIPRLSLEWNNLIRKAVDCLRRQGLSDQEAEELIAPARLLITRRDPRRPGVKGVAAFLGRGFSRAIHLPEPVASCCLVGEEFHLVPLLYLLGRHRRFHVLALSSNSVRLVRVEGGLVETLELPGLAPDMRAALQGHDRDDYLGLHTTAAGAVAGHGAMFHGQAVGIDDEKKDKLLFFRMVDRAVHRALGNDGAPLVLATTHANQALYREANTHAHLLEECIPGNPDRVKADQLANAGFELVAPLAAEEWAKPVRRVLGGLGLGHVEEDPGHLKSEARDGGVEILVLPGGEKDGNALNADPHASPCPLVNRLIGPVLSHRGTVVFGTRAEFEGHRLPCGLLRHGRRAASPVV